MRDTALEPRPLGVGVIYMNGILVPRRSRNKDNIRLGNRFRKNDRHPNRQLPMLRRNIFYLQITRNA